MDNLDRSEVQGLPIRKRAMLEEADKERRFGFLERFLDTVPSHYQGFGVQDIREGWQGALSTLATEALEHLHGIEGFVTLRGPKGVGKSSLAVTVAKKMIYQHSVPGSFISFPALMNDFSYEMTKENVVTRLSSIPVLVIDDVGVASETITPHQSKLLWNLIDNRWSSGDKLTIMTTNMSVASQTSRGGASRSQQGLGLIDLFGESAWDRISQNNLLITMMGDSLRG